MAKHRTLSNRLGRAQLAYLVCQQRGDDSMGTRAADKWFDRRDRVEKWIRAQTPHTEEELAIMAGFERLLATMFEKYRVVPTARALATVNFKVSENAYRVQRGEGWITSEGTYRSYK